MSRVIEAVLSDNGKRTLDQWPSAVGRWTQIDAQEGTLALINAEVVRHELTDATEFATDSAAYCACLRTRGRRTVN